MTVGEPINILLIEHSPDGIETMRQTLAQVSDGRLVVKRAGELSDALNELAQGGINVILLDISSSEGQGWKDLVAVSTLAPEVPVVMATSPDGERLAIRMLREGAQDYFVKGNTDGKVILQLMRHAIEHQEAEKQIRHQNRQLSILQEVGRAVSSSLDVHRVLAILLEEINIFLPYPAVSIRLFNETTGTLEPVASRNFDTEEWKKHVKVSHGGLSKRVFDSRSPLRIKDVLREPGTPNLDFFKRHGLISYLGIPLVIKDKGIGVLSVFTKKRHDFSNEDVKFLSTLADQAAIAIHNSQVYEKSQRQAWALQEELAERRKVEEALRIANQSFCSIVERSGDGIIVVDQDGVVRFSNPVAQAMFGYRAEKILGSMFGFPMIAGEMMEIDIVRSDGKVGIAEMRFVETEWEGNKAYLVSLRDITEHKELDRMKDRFFSAVSHDLRTPLNAVKGYLDLLLDGAYGALSGEPAEVIRSVAQATKSMSELVSALLALGKMQSGRYALSIESVEVQDVVDEVIEEVGSLAEVKGLTLSKEIGGGPVLMKSDRRSVKQILSNLVGNAIKFTDRGGVKVLLDSVAGSTGSRKDQVKIRIEDSGCGIKHHHFEKIFDEFYQVDENGSDTGTGTGLGLAICKRLVELLGGEITVESEVNKGTAFTVVLPREIAEKASSETKGNRKRTTVKREKAKGNRKSQRGECP